MKLEPRPAVHMEKLLLTAVIGWVGALRDLQGRANCVSQVDGVPNIPPACQLCGSASLSVWEKAVPQLSP